MKQDFKINASGLLLKYIHATHKSATVQLTISIFSEHLDSPTLHSLSFIMMVFLH